LQEFLRQHAAQFTSVDRALAEYPPGRLDGMEWIFEKLALRRAQASQLKKRLHRLALAD
jgi:hypothetical protein